MNEREHKTTQQELNVKPALQWRGRLPNIHKLTRVYIIINKYFRIIHAIIIYYYVRDNV